MAPKFLIALTALVSFSQPNSISLESDLIQDIKNEYEAIPHEFLDNLPTVDQFRGNLPEPENFYLRVTQAHKRAQNILLKASAALRDRQDQTNSKIYETAFNRLQAAQIFWPSGTQTFQKCGPQTVAYAFIGGPNRIYLCRLSFDFNQMGLAQVLVHESAHLQGYKDECDATLIEVGAMTWAKEEIAFKNAYWDRCFKNTDN